MTCDHCGEAVVEGVYCTRCGAHQGTTLDAGDAKTRRHSYAAHPGEHVGHPNLFSTLFPHAGPHKIHEFRWAFIAGLAGVFALYLFGLISIAVLVSAFLVPVLYLLYLVEAQVFKGEPLPVLGLTLVGGAVLGLVVTLGVHAIAPDPVVGGLAAGIDWLALLGLAVALPVVQEILKPLPTIMLRRRGFDETLDGLVFGVAAGLGFSIAETIVNFSSLFTSTGLRTDSGNWIYPLITVAVLQPVMQGSATGLIAASLWRRRNVLGVAAAVAAHVLFSAGSSIIRDLGAAAIVVDVFQAAVVGGLLVAIRYTLHHALIDEARHMGFSETVCTHCHKHVFAAGFCPSCGLALPARPTSVKAAATPVKTATEGA